MAIGDYHDEFGEERDTPDTHRWWRSSVALLLYGSGITVCAVIIAIASAMSGLIDYHLTVWSIVAVTSIISVVITIIVWNRVRIFGQYIIAYRVTDVAIKPKVLFLWVFGFAKILSAALQLAKGFNCIQRNAKQMFPGEIFLSIFTNFSEIVFVIFQLCFLSSHSSVKLREDTIVSFGLSTIILTHIFQWFEMLFASLSKNDLINISSVNETNNSCFHSITSNKLMENISPYIEPMSTEFGLLAVGIIFRLLPASLRQPQIAVDPGDQQWTNNVREEEENTPLLRVNDFNSRSPLERSDSTDKASASGEVGSHFLQMPSFYRCLLVAFIICLPLLITIILHASEQADIQLSLGVVQFLFKVELLFLLILNCCLWCNQFKRLNLYSDKYDGKLVLLLSTAGTLLYMMFGLVAGCVLLSRKVSSIATFLILQKILEIVIVVIQTSLILKAQSLHVHRVNQEPKRISASKVFFTFFLIRVIMWTTDSYIGKSTTKIMPIETEVYGVNYWDTINDMLYPITMFYLFHTAIDLYQLYKKYDQS